MWFGDCDELKKSSRFRGCDTREDEIWAVALSVSNTWFLIGEFSVFARLKISLAPSWGPALDGEGVAECRRSGELLTGLLNFFGESDRTVPTI